MGGQGDSLRGSSSTVYCGWFWVKGGTRKGMEWSEGGGRGEGGVGSKRTKRG